MFGLQVSGSRDRSRDRHVKQLPKKTKDAGGNMQHDPDDRSVINIHSLLMTIHR